MITERLQRALDRGWIAPSAVEDSRRVLMQLDANKATEMEAMFGKAAGDS